MVTWYYLSKFSKNQKADIEKYYNNLIKPPCIKKHLCRICLSEGKVPINDNISEALELFGDIQLSENEEYPKYLCETCHRFIKIAIQFRKTAKESNETLRKTMKLEVDLDNGHSEQNQDQNDDIIDPDPMDWQEDIRNIKIEKRDKVKYSQKVTCHVCKKVINRSYIKEHVTMHDPNHHKYVCEVCGKSFRLRCAYYNHSIRHREDFPYKCQFCPYRGRYPELLKNHMRTHTGDYSYMCTECPARFLFKSNLNCHMLKHKEPQFQCDTCKRAFHTKLKLQRHYEVDHLGIRNHICPMCGKAFGYRNAMMKHQLRVHKREKSSFGRLPSYLAVEQNQQNLYTTNT